MKAQYNLGLMNYNGEGGPENFAEVKTLPNLNLLPAYLAYPNPTLNLLMCSTY